MPIYPIEFSDEEDQRWQDYLAIQQDEAANERHPRRTFSTVHALLLSFLESPRRMVQRVVEEHAQKAAQTRDMFAGLPPDEQVAQARKVLEQHEKRQKSQPGYFDVET